MPGLFLSCGRGAIARASEGPGLRPWTPRGGSASSTSAKGSGPWNPLMGLFSGEGLHGPRNVAVGPPLRTNPIDRLQSHPAAAPAPLWKKMLGLRDGLRRRTRFRHSEPVTAERPKQCPVVVSPPLQSLVRAASRVLPFVASGNGEHA